MKTHGLAGARSQQGVEGATAKSATLAEATLDDSAEITRMLRLLDPEAEAFVFFSAPDVKPSAERPQHRHGPPSEAIISWMRERQRKDCGVFVTVQAMRGKQRSNADLDRIRTVFVDWDHAGKPLPEFPVVPSMIVETSPGRFHLYWLLHAEERLSPEAFAGIMRCLVEVYGSDENAKDLSRVLRIAGTANLKREPAHRVRITEASGRRYSDEELVLAFPAPPVLERSPEPGRLNGHTAGTPPDGVMAKRHRAYALKGLDNDAHDLARLSKPRRNRALFEAAARWGKYVHNRVITMDELEMPLLKACTINKLDRDNSPRDCQKTIANGLAEAAHDVLNDLPPRDSSAPMGQPSNDEDFVLIEGRAIAKTEGNIRRALTKAGIRLGYNSFARQRTIHGLSSHGPDLTDAAIDAIWIQFEREHGVRFIREHLSAVIRDQAHANSFHPVRDYLDGLAWDGKPRLDTWLATYAGAEDTELNRQFGRLTLIAAVRRVRRPGTKFDAMLVLEGPEGRNKSTLFEMLASPSWFSDDAPLNAEARETIERLRGKRIVEAADLSAVRGTEVERLKAFLSRCKDTATLKYERETTTAPRECIFVGTTNSAEYLQSKTGNRRFWPVRVGTIDLEALRRDRDQLWAEAAFREATETSIMLPEEFWQVAAEEQEKRRESDAWEEDIAAYLERRRLRKPLVSAADVALGALNLQLRDLGGASQRRLTEAMRLAGWSKEAGKTVRGKRLWGPRDAR